MSLGAGVVNWARPRALRLRSFSGLGDTLGSRRVVSARSSTPPPEVAGGWRLRHSAIAAGLAAWLLALTFIGLRVTAIEDTPGYAKLRRPFHWLYAFTGIREHAVFVDHHFADYDRELSMWERQGTDLEPLPFITRWGESGRWMRGRVWAVWSWRVAFPRLSEARQKAGLARFAAFWAGRAESDRSVREIVIRQRPLEVSLDAWKPGLPRRNRERPWQDVARLTVE
jgi:hypothetical protein